MLSKVIYNTFFRKSSVYMAGIFASAFAFEIAFDESSDLIWDRLNKGRQWKDIRGSIAAGSSE